MLEFVKTLENQCAQYADCYQNILEQLKPENKMTRLELLIFAKLKMLPLIYFTQVEYFQREARSSFTTARVVVQAILLQLYEEMFSSYYKTLLNMVAQNTITLVDAEYGYGPFSLVMPAIQLSAASGTVSEKIRKAH